MHFTNEHTVIVCIHLQGTSLVGTCTNYTTLEEQCMTTGKREHKDRPTKIKKGGRSDGRYNNTRGRGMYRWVRKPERPQANT